MKNENQTGAADSAQSAPELWRVMPCPKHAGKHPFHDHRWIVTADAAIEWNHDRSEWSLSRGSLVAEMRDGPPENARKAAAAPALLAALLECRRMLRELHQLHADAWHVDEIDAVETADDLATEAIKLTGQK